MIRVVRQADAFWADMLKQVDWYREKAGPEVAERYVNAVEATLLTLAETPGLGRPRFLRLRELAGIRSWRVQRPYHRHLIFYRFDDATITAERIIHGAVICLVACFSQHKVLHSCSVSLGHLFCRLRLSRNRAIDPRSSW
jgi:toxin ParE1/3/4